MRRGWLIAGLVRYHDAPVYERIEWVWLKAMSSSANRTPLFSHHGTLPLWLAEDQEKTRSALDRDVDVDVAIIGAGIAGITTALLLQRDGASVAVLERDRVAGGASGYTTAKVSALQQTAYTDVLRYHGESGAQAYAAASLAALDLIAGFVAEGIDCAWERLPAFLYAADESQVGAVREEAAIAQAAGLAVELTGDVPLPFPMSLAARLEGQAQFDPVRYVRGLADRLTTAGGLIFEGTAVTKVHDGSPCRVETEPGGTVQARDVIVCTNYPILDRGLFFARTQATRSYLVAARVSDAGPRGMLITAGQPTRSLRSYTGPEGEHWVLVGGEGHTTGSGEAQPERYKRLEAFAREHFDVIDVPFRWSTQDAMPADKLPYAGPYTPLPSHLLVNAGGQKWGMTNGTIGAAVLADRLAGREHPQAGAFNPNRLSLRTLPSLAKATAHVGAHFVRDRVNPADVTSAGEVPAGEARVMRAGLGKTGVYRDQGGALHAVSLRCTHLGCLLRFNDAERSWDCPCHGSRFDVDGAVLAGPATQPLQSRDPAS